MEQKNEKRTEQQKRQPDTLRPEESQAGKTVELDLDQLNKVSGGTHVPPPWMMEEE